MRDRVLLVILLLFSTVVTSAKEKSDKMKPRWVTSSLPAPKSPGYIFILAQGSGKSLEEARQMTMVNLTSKLEHERGMVISSYVKIKKTADKNTGAEKNSEFSLEASEEGKQIDLTCRVVDEYWEHNDGIYLVTELFTVNNSSQLEKRNNNDIIRLTTSYGLTPVIYSLIPGVGQFVKGSTLKGSLLLSGTALGATAILLCENQRATYTKKMKEYPQHFDFYRNKKSDWELGRNIAIGATIAVYVFNLIDAAIAPARRQVIVRKNKYNYALSPVIYNEGIGIGFAMNF